MDFDNTLVKLQEGKKTQMIELACGCNFNIPSNIKEGLNEYEEYLEDKGIVERKRVGVSQENLICSKCGKTIAKDV